MLTTRLCRVGSRRASSNTRRLFESFEVGVRKNVLCQILRMLRGISRISDYRWIANTLKVDRPASMRAQEHVGAGAGMGGLKKLSS